MDEKEKQALDRFERLIKAKDRAVFTNLTDLKVDQDIEGTKTKVRCYSITLDGNLLPATKDLVDFIVGHAVNYCIPESEMAKARQEDKKYGTDSRMARLIKRAHGLFNNLSKTGEPGELLLYILVREVLRLPLLVCKMSLKTDPALHYQGVDGIHAKVEKGADNIPTLALYWGESKVYARVGSAITDCIDSLKSYVIADAHGNQTAKRDMELISANLNVADEDLKEALLLYFDKDHPASKRINYRGVALVGFTEKSYPSIQNTKNQEELLNEIRGKVNDWVKKIHTALGKHVGLEEVEIHFFLVSMDDVNIFRDEFRKSLKLL